MDIVERIEIWGEFCHLPRPTNATAWFHPWPWDALHEAQIRNPLVRDHPKDRSLDVGVLQRNESSSNGASLTQQYEESIKGIETG